MPERLAKSKPDRSGEVSVPGLWNEIRVEMDVVARKTTR
jgi:hypothetical protein